MTDGPRTMTNISVCRGFDDEVILSYRNRETNVHHTWSALRADTRIKGMNARDFLDEVEESHPTECHLLWIARYSSMETFLEILVEYMEDYWIVEPAILAVGKWARN